MVKLCEYKIPASKLPECFLKDALVDCFLCDKQNCKVKEKAQKELTKRMEQRIINNANF